MKELTIKDVVSWFKNKKDKINKEENKVKEKVNKEKKGQHNWSQWRVQNRFKVSNLRPGGPERDRRTTGEITIQERRCQKCGLSEITKNEWKL